LNLSRDEDSVTSLAAAPLAGDEGGSLVALAGINLAFARRGGDFLEMVGLAILFPTPLRPSPPPPPTSDKITEAVELNLSRDEDSVTSLAAAPLAGDEGGFKQRLYGKQLLAFARRGGDFLEMVGLAILFPTPLRY
jgi:hypothetical protein